MFSVRIAATALIASLPPTRAAAEPPPVGPLPSLEHLFPYPIAAGAILGVALTSMMLFFTDRYDKSGGALTISILIVIGMLGAVGYCLIYTIPIDDITPGVVGGLTAGFGAVVAHWLGRPKDGPPP